MQHSLVHITQNKSGSYQIMRVCAPHAFDAYTIMTVIWTFWWPSLHVCMSVGADGAGFFICYRTLFDMGHLG